MPTNVMDQHLSAHKALKKLLENYPARYLTESAKFHIEYSSNLQRSALVKLRFHMRTQNTGPIMAAPESVKSSEQEALEVMQERAILNAASMQAEILTDAKSKGMECVKEDYSATIDVQSMAYEHPAATEFARPLNHSASEADDPPKVASTAADSDRTRIKEKDHTHDSEDQLTTEITESMLAEMTAKIAQAAEEQTNSMQQAASSIDAPENLENHWADEADQPTLDDGTPNSLVTDLKQSIKALERELTLADTRGDILRTQLEMSEQKAEIFRTQLLEWQNETYNARRQLDESKADFAKLQVQTEMAQQDRENLQKAVSLAWQQGYMAGRAAAPDEDRQEREFQQLPSSTSDIAFANANTMAPDSTIHFAPDAAVHLDDPQIINDPFTGKLIDALGCDISEFSGANELFSQKSLALDEESALMPPPSAPPLPAIDHEDLHRHNTAQRNTTPTESTIASAAKISSPPQDLASAVSYGCAPPLPPRGDYAENTIWTESSPSAKPSKTDNSSAATDTGRTLAASDTIMGLDDLAPAADRETSEERPVTAETTETGVDSYYQSEWSPNGSEASADSEEAINASIAAVSHQRQDNETTQNFTADELHKLFRNRMEDKKDPSPAPAVSNMQQSGTTKKFVGGKHSAAANNVPMPRVFPPEIRKACRLLGINPEDITTRQSVTDAWKKEMSKPGVHPDTGGDTEMAIYLNTAKDTLMRWVDDQTPKLGKKFGSSVSRDTTKQQKQE